MPEHAYPALEAAVQGEVADVIQKGWVALAQGVSVTGAYVRGIQSADSIVHNVGGDPLAVAVQNVNWGFPSVREFYPFVKPTGKPYRIKAGETFQVKVYWPGGAVTLSAASTVKTYIIGIYYIAL